MKITQEEFKKLKQLDRIEYRQKYLNINEHFKCDLTTQSVTNFFIITSMITLAIPLYWHIFGIFLAGLKELVIIFLLIVILSIFIDFVFYVKKKVQLNKLDEEYFKVINKK